LASNFGSKVVSPGFSELESEFRVVNFLTLQTEMEFCKKIDSTLVVNTVLSNANQI